MPAPSLCAILAARRRLEGRLRPTPLVRAAWLSEATGAEVWLKPECLQRSHSFKIRGALNALLEREGGGRRGPVVTASAGNHGRALAEAAAETGTPCTVFTPATAPRAKQHAIVAAGARLEATARDYDEAEVLARRFAHDRGAAFISAYNHPAVIAGAATIGLELLAELPETDLVVVPVGGGGLLSGVGLAVRGVAPTVKIVGVEAALNPVFHAARRHGAVVPITVQDSLADGLSGNVEEGSLTCALVERLADDLVLADERDIARAVGALAGDARLVVEGAGAVGVAAVASGRLAGLDGRRVVIVVSGSNIDRERLAAALAVP